MAFYHKTKLYLCEFEVGDLQPEFKNEHLWYVSMGSGQSICDTVLGFVRKIFWDDAQPNLNDGIFGTVWALKQAIELNPGGINYPIQLATISEKGETKLLDISECSEHEQHTVEFEEYLKKFKSELLNNPVDIPKV